MKEPYEMNPAILLKPAALVDKFSQSAYRRLSIWILRKGGVKIHGSPLWVSPQVYWDLGSPGSITLGDRCVISHQVKLLTHDFSLDRVAERKFGQSDRELSRRSPISIGAQAFIGMGAIILPGISIGSGAVVGAGSVVTRDVPDDTVVAGNPARLLCTAEEYWERSASEFRWGKRRP